MTDKIKTLLQDTLKPLAEVGGGVLKFKRGDNIGPILGRIYVFQEMEKYAKDQLKIAWKDAVTEDIISGDDVLRDTAGERIATESNQFSCIVNVEKSRANFNKEKFIETVATKFKIPKGKLEALAETSTKDSAAPLSKKILEA